jgi:hypothetical protein
MITWRNVRRINQVSADERHRRKRCPGRPLQEIVMKYIALLLLLGCVTLTSIGCEASGKVDADNDHDHKAKVKIDAD